MDNTLEIYFYWAGKGTNSIPQRGVYGPLISAISVTPSRLTKFLIVFPSFSLVFLGVFIPMIFDLVIYVDFKPDTGNHHLSTGAIVGIVAGACAVTILIFVVVWVCWRRKNADNNGNL